MTLTQFLKNSSRRCSTFVNHSWQLFLQPRRRSRAEDKFPYGDIKVHLDLSAAILFTNSLRDYWLVIIAVASLLSCYWSIPMYSPVHFGSPFARVCLSDGPGVRLCVWQPSCVSFVCVSTSSSSFFIGVCLSACIRPGRGVSSPSLSICRPWSVKNSCLAPRQQPPPVPSQRTDAVAERVYCYYARRYSQHHNGSRQTCGLIIGADKVFEKWKERTSFAVCLYGFVYCCCI